MTVDTSQKVGVGTQTPTSLFSVGGSSQFQVDSSGQIVKINNTTTAYPWVNADISASAAIAGSKLAAITQSAAGVDASAAQRLGTNTNDSASAGNIGEVMSQVVATTSFAAASAAYQDFGGNGNGLALTAGDWDCTARIYLSAAGATTITSYLVGITSTTGNSATGLVAGGNYFQLGGWTAALTPTYITLPNVRVSTTGGTTYYTKLFFQGTGTKPTYEGTFSCRRMR